MADSKPAVSSVSALNGPSARIQAPLILVVGMHRSGTSLLGSLLDGLGISSSGELIAGDHNNPEGYFERADITAIQERLLSQLGRWWPSSQGVLPLPANWLLNPNTQQARQELLALIEAENPATPIAIKDPRSSRLLPLWRRVASEAKRPLQLILALRHPQEVCTSLVERDGASTGMDANRAVSLWLQHNGDVLRHSKGLPLLVVDYSLWFQPNAHHQIDADAATTQLKALARFVGLPEPAPSQLSALLTRIRPEHRRSLEGPVNVPQHCLTLYRKLQQGDLMAATGPEPSALLPTSDDPELNTHPWGCIALRDCQGASEAAKQLLLGTWAADGLSPQRAGPELIGSWFDPDYYSSSNSDLLAAIPANDAAALLRHYLLHGWKEGRQPHPLFDAGHYFKQLIERGIPLLGDQSPLEHFLRAGLPTGLSPNLWFDRQWWARHGETGFQVAAPPALHQLHPWGAAAMALADHDLPSATYLLRDWIDQSAPDTAVLDLAREDQTGNLRWWNAPSPASSSELELQSWPLGLPLWQQFGHLASLHAPQGNLLLCLEEPNQDTLLHWLRHYPNSPLQIAEADPARLRLWQRFGINTVCLTQPSAAELDHWLAADPWLQHAEQQLGLPHPEALSPLSVLCLGEGGPEWNKQTQLSIGYFPGFHDLILQSQDDARALASWLWHCHNQGLHLVEFNENDTTPLPLCWLPLLRVNPLRFDEALLTDYVEQTAATPSDTNLITPQPSHRVLFEHNGTEPAATTVVVSLFNYGERILEALESVQQQSLAALELIVVDDASQDHGPVAVQTWMERVSTRFSRCLLVQHENNGGLAAARNTAFQLASANWCFVLDADNSLRPHCIERCLAVASNGSENLAVVHPLLQRRNDRQISDGLVSGLSWQQGNFLQGNYIDAMALVKRQAWRKVEGYSHSADGWEDYDFWCKLIEAGFHGTLCPQVLAHYTVHSDSMAHQNSQPKVRALSRLLQGRHPWLHLPLA